MRCSIAIGAAALAAGVMLGMWTGHGANAATRGAIPPPEINPKRVSTPAAPDKAVTPSPVPVPPRISPALRKKVERTLDAEALLKPVLSYELTSPDTANLKATISAVYKSRFSDARAAMGRIKDKYAAKVALWYYYRSRGLGAKGDEIEAFRLANPEWPDQDRLRENAERSLFVHGASAETIKTFFATSPPQTGAGKAAIGAMHFANGEKEKAKVLIAEAWRNYRLIKAVEDEILEKYSGLLSEADHKARIDRLLLQDSKSRIESVQRAAKFLPEDEQAKIEARIEVVRRTKKADKMLAGIPVESANHDIGLYLSRIQWLRRNDKEEEAWTLLSEAPHEPALLLDLDEWWVERRVNCRSALNSGKPELAYAIARDHGPISGENYADAEFLAGWIALRFLGRIDDAQKHFLALRTSVQDPKPIARAEYWLGRTSLAAGDLETASARFRDAARYPFTFYGQLARQSLSKQAEDLPVEPAPEPTPAEVKAFSTRDAVMAIAVARAANFSSLSTMFFHQLARTLKSPGELVLLAELGRAVDQPYVSVRLGKIAFNRGMPTAEYAFPVGMLPEYKEINGRVEPAFLHALSRQESEFNPNAKSPVGARGLMQLMPRTARAVARQFKVHYRASKLTGDPAYNLMLGVAHLSDLIESYRGSYILTLIAYNAGGGRVSEWTRQFGDPRDPQVDPIDWIERIPFTETREYVQKILTTVQIFRSRLEGPGKALRLMQDLNRHLSKTVDAASGAPMGVTVSPSN